MIVEMKVVCKRYPALLRRVVGLEVDLLVLDAPPQPLDEDVIDPASLAVPADADFVFLEHTEEGFTGELSLLFKTNFTEPVLDRHGPGNNCLHFLFTRQAVDSPVPVPNSRKRPFTFGLFRTICGSSHSATLTHAIHG